MATGLRRLLLVIPLAIQQPLCIVVAMVDIDLLVKQLRRHGHTVEGVHQVPPNAGEWEFIIDGNFLNLDEARRVLELDEAK